MKLAIERVDDENVKFVIESNVITDVTGNDWLLEVTNDKIYITYEGRLGDRFASLKVISKSGQEFKSSHENVFTLFNNSFDSYYWIRTIIKKNKTLGVWGCIQEGLLENPLNIQVGV